VPVPDTPLPAPVKDWLSAERALIDTAW